MQYCPNCGAANKAKRTNCFACSQPLSATPNDKVTQPEESLLKDRYRLLTQIGSGGFGAVYRAQDHAELDRIVAVKAINLHGLTPTQVIEATDGFNRELNLLSSLSHRHVPQIYDHFTDAEHWYLVMQFIDGSTLEDYLRDPHPQTVDPHTTRILPLDEILEMALQLCDVLQYLHSRQPTIIYRDLKPSNIMRTPEGQLYLIDFGIARSYKEGKSKDTIPLGSPGYAAPEQYGKAQTTPRADIYSLGALLHQLLTGIDPSEAPFSFMPLRVYGEEGIAALDDLLTRMVDLNPDKRPPSIQVVSQSIHEIIQSRQKQTPTPINVTPDVPPPTPYYPPPPFQSRQNYSNPYYKPSQAQQQQQQQQLPPQLTAQQSRRRFLRGGIAGALVLAGVVGYETFLKHNGPTDSPQTQFQPTYIRTQTRQKKIISLDTWYSTRNSDVAFASADDAGTLTFWGYNLQAKYTVALGAPVRSLDWAPNQQYLLAATDHEVYLLQLKDLSPQKKTASPQERITITQGTQAPYVYITVRPGEDSFQVTDSNGVTTFFQQYPQIETNHWIPVKQVAGPALKSWQDISYNSNTNSMVAHDDNMIIVWDSDAGNVQGSLPIDQANGKITALGWNDIRGNDGGGVAIGRSNGVVQFWDYMANSTVVKTQNSSSGAITTLTADYTQGRYISAAGQNIILADQQTFNDQSTSLQISYPNAQLAIDSVAVTQLPTTNSIPGAIYAAVTGEKFVQFWRPNQNQSSHP